MAGAVLAPRAGKRIRVALTPARATPRRRTGWAVNRDTAETLPPVRVCTELCVDKDAERRPKVTQGAPLRRVCRAPVTVPGLSRGAPFSRVLCTPLGFR